MLEFLPQDPNAYVFWDVETRALPGSGEGGDVTKVGIGRYAENAKVTMFQYAIGEGPVKVWALDDFDKSLRWIDLPPDLAEAMQRVYRGEAWFVAWNSAFDRKMCNRGMVAARKGDTLPVRCVLDAMAQAAASNLPLGLDRAHKAVGGSGKLPDGKPLIKIFAPEDGGTPQTHPEKWQEFIDYGVQDVEALRDVFLSTRPLPIDEWEQFWTSEDINDRGMPVDRDYVRRASELAALYKGDVNRRVEVLTDGDLWSVNQHVAMAQYVFDALQAHPDAVSILTKRYVEDEEGGLVPAKISLDRGRVQKLIPYLERVDREQGLTDQEFAMLELLEIREFGASATPLKFGKMLKALDRFDRLQGQYAFNGASQTGRFSSRGVQTHNLVRAALPDETDVIDFIMAMDL